MNSARFRLTLATTVLLACSTPPQAQSSQPAPDIAIRNARLAQNAAIAARNADSVASFWVEDVAITAGLGFVLRGRNAYRAAFGSDAAMLYVRTPTRIVVSNNWPLAWEEGTWTGTASGVQSTPTLSGRYSAQWVNEDGRWRIRSELFVTLECTAAACQFPITLR